MTLTDIIIKVLLFFGVFYGAIFIASFIGKKLRERNNSIEKAKDNKQKKD
jgi:hypothetical protein